MGATPGDIMATIAALKRSGLLAASNSKDLKDVRYADFKAAGKTSIDGADIAYVTENDAGSKKPNKPGKGNCHGEPLVIIKAPSGDMKAAMREILGAMS